MPLEPIGPNSPAQAPLTADQKAALQKLHDAAQQMESLFVNMLFQEMRKTSPETSLTGPPSQAETTFRDMLDEKRAEELSKTGSLGIGKLLEEQLRASVLGTPSNVAVPPTEERK